MADLVNDEIFLNNLVGKLRGLVPVLEQGAREVAALLQEDKLPAAFDALRQVIEALQCFHEGLAVLEARGCLAASGLERLNEQLKEIYPTLLAALEGKDTVALADVLQYELAEAFTNCVKGMVGSGRND